jgi:hypothetical protein
LGLDSNGAGSGTNYLVSDKQQSGRDNGQQYIFNSFPAAIKTNNKFLFTCAVDFEPLDGALLA